MCLITRKGSTSVPSSDPTIRGCGPACRCTAEICFPSSPPELRAAVLDYLDALTTVGHIVLSGIALGLGLEGSWFRHHLTADPLVLLRVFRYPPLATTDAPWSVGEHTDYGLLTILGQDGRAGLEVRTADGWVPVPSERESFVCNLGDMLERLTGGLYRSTPHRVRNVADMDRLSIPFFLDPSWTAPGQPSSIVERPDDDHAASAGRHQRARLRRHLRRVHRGQGWSGLPSSGGGCRQRMSEPTSEHETSSATYAAVNVHYPRSRPHFVHGTPRRKGLRGLGRRPRTGPPGSPRPGRAWCAPGPGGPRQSTLNEVQTEVRELGPAPSPCRPTSPIPSNAPDSWPRHRGLRRRSTCW